MGPSWVLHPDVSTPPVTPGVGLERGGDRT